MANSRELKEITHESMQAFVETHGPVIKIVEAWMMSRAEQRDGDALNHFREAITLFFEEACRRIESNHPSKRLKTFLN